MNDDEDASSAVPTAGEAERNAAMQSGMAGPSPPEPATPPDRAHVAFPGLHYTEGAGLFLPIEFCRYGRVPGDPLYRPLRVYEADPVISGYNGRSVSLPVAYEPLRPGPIGRVIEVVPASGTHPVDLDGIAEALGQGRAPSVTDPFFHQQMVYALASDVVASFAMALGREPSWGFGGPRLRLRIDAADAPNAWYDSGKGEIVFGRFTSDAAPGPGIVPNATIRTCISRDIVVHEMTHALLDGMRARFAVATQPDVPAFHEGFSDLVAILQRFSIRGSVEAAIRQTKGKLAGASLVSAIAEEFGMSTGLGRPLREPLSVSVPDLPTAGSEEHDRGTVMVTAVLEALVKVYARRARPVLDLVAGRPARTPLPEQAVEILTDLACRLGSHFLSLAIRAIDYCPPVDLHLGEYLRALITADRDLVEDDRYGYRSELIAAFARKRIFPPEVNDLSEDSLLWRAPRHAIPPIPGLALSALSLPADPGRPPDRAEIRRQAAALADRVTDPAYLGEFGLLPPGEDVAPPSMDSVRVLRRVGPDRQVQMGLVCEITQEARIRGPDGRILQGIGGATVILGGAGEIRFVIGKSVSNAKRAAIRGETEQKLAKAGAVRGCATLVPRH